jgi:hypothetical protein
VPEIPGCAAVSPVLVLLGPVFALPALLARCLDLARASVPQKEAFCRSLPDSGARARCWKYRYNNLEWTGWCLFEFSD